MRHNCGYLIVVMHAMTVPAHLDAAKPNQAGDYYSPAQSSLDHEAYLDWLAADQPAPWDEGFEDYDERSSTPSWPG